MDDRSLPLTPVPERRSRRSTYGGGPLPTDSTDGSGTIGAMRSLLSALAVLLGSLAATVALTAYVAHETVLDPDQVGDVVAEGLGQDQLRERMLATVVPGYTDLPDTYRDDVDRAAGHPAVEDALADVTVDERGRADVGPVRRELAQSLRERGYPELASQVNATEGRDRLRLPGRLWEAYTDARDTSWLVATRGALTAAALFAFAVLVARSRRAAVRGVGLAVLLSGGAAALLLVALPVVAEVLVDAPWVGTIADVASAASSSDLVEPLIPVGLAGAFLVVVSFMLPRPHRR